MSYAGGVRVELVIGPLLCVAAAGIYFWGLLRRNSRRLRSARRFAGSLVNRYGDAAEDRARQQLKAALTRRERLFRRAVLKVLTGPAPPAPTAARERPPAEAAPGGEPPRIEPEPFADFNGAKRRFSREDIFFLMAVGLAAAGAITLILVG